MMKSGKHIFVEVLRKIEKLFLKSVKINQISEHEIFHMVPEMENGKLAVVTG